MADSSTLLLAIRIKIDEQKTTDSLISIYYQNGKWKRVDKVKIDSERGGDIHFTEIFNKYVMFGEWDSNLLYIERVTAAHKIEPVERIELPEKIAIFDARIVEGGAIIACIGFDKSYVLFYFLREDFSINQILTIHLEETWRILWCGDILLAGCLGQRTTYSVFEIVISDYSEGKYVSKKVHEGIDIGDWRALSDNRGFAYYDRKIHDVLRQSL